MRVYILSLVGCVAGSLGIAAVWTEPARATFTLGGHLVVTGGLLFIISIWVYSVWLVDRES
jgi:hypothetical protein